MTATVIKWKYDGSVSITWVLWKLQGTLDSVKSIHVGLSGFS